MVDPNRLCRQGRDPRHGEECIKWTVNDVIVNVGWRMETKIPEGAIDLLMVPEHPMLEPVSGDGEML
jgi:hypothetical protein